MFFLIFLLFVIVSGEITTYPPDKDSLQCNGHNSLCDVQYNRITFLATRSSFATNSIDNPYNTQTLSITDQLNAGIRAINLDVYLSAGTPHLCFPDCSLGDYGALQDTLVQISTWLNSNTDQVLTIILNNPTKMDPILIQNAFQSSGLYSLVYTKTVAQPWDTLRTMINTKKRLIVLESINLGITPALPWVFSYTDNVLRTNYGSDYAAQNWDCGPYSSIGATSLLYIPHVKLETKTINGVPYQNLPSSSTAKQINDDSAYLHATACRSSYSYPWMSFIEIDFYVAGTDLDLMILGLNSLNLPNDKEINYVPQFTKRTAPKLNSSFQNHPKLYLSAILSLFLAIF
ncbi:hypothetical protein BB559_006611 [Furculomyces boomerangus]|uniref:Phosphatidylinositol-specific phospholipase C X domain-containing protein n=2 Tax=Harpellales TaxID=61421 RepID=A0A2T9Y1H4_9FUNG|nr:hypothetical protein BB559_006611 [Furculomyces boomerangus]PVZ98623.1 hypothetical protein BB558_005373 [Smittium angustum]